MMKIIETRHWHVVDVHEMCVRENLYTCGHQEQYDAMFQMVACLTPTVENIYKVAEDINRHSVGQTVTNIMYMLANDVIKSCFDIEE